MITIKINPEKIRDVIGKGGSVIRALTEETGTTIDISDDGVVTIASTSSEGMAEAKKRIENITVEVEVGQVYEGTVLKLLDFGAIVNILPGKDGLLHISEIANERIKDINDYLKEGQQVKVKVIQTDEKGRVRLSAKALLNEGAPRARRLRSRRRSNPVVVIDENGRPPSKRAGRFFFRIGVHPLSLRERSVGGDDESDRNYGIRRSRSAGVRGAPRCRYLVQAKC